VSSTFNHSHDISCKVLCYIYVIPNNVNQFILFSHREYTIELHSCLSVCVIVCVTELSPANQQLHSQQLMIFIGYTIYRPLVFRLGYSCHMDIEHYNINERPVTTLLTNKLYGFSNYFYTA